MHKNCALSTSQKLCIVVCKCPLMQISQHSKIDIFKKFIVICYIDCNFWSITLNILDPIREISFMTTNCNYLYLFVSLFKVSHDKLDNLVNDWFIETFKAKCIVVPFAWNKTFPMYAITKVFVFSKFDDNSLIYKSNKPHIISFKVKKFLFQHPIRNKCIGSCGYNFFFYT